MIYSFIVVCHNILEKRQLGKNSAKNFDSKSVFVFKLFSTSQRRLDRICLQCTFGFFKFENHS